MALMPKRSKYRKQQRRRIRGMATRGNSVEFGDYGLQALEAGFITARQIEAGRIAATRMSREGKIFIRIFPHKPMTSTPAETRMGKGKGEPEFYVAAVKPGTVLYEISGVTEEQAVLTFNRVAFKLPIKVRFAKRRLKA
jgi:large subunit ribosomal protein L16